MDIEKLFEIAPYYVAGTLKPDERELFEKELQKSSQLQERVKFLKITRHTLLAEKQYAEQKHLIYDDIIDYAQGIITDKIRQRSIENHLETCTNCLREVEAIHKIWKETEKVNPLKVSIKNVQSFLLNITELLPSLLQPTRIAYVTAGLAVIIIGIIFIPPFFSGKVHEQLIGMSYDGAVYRGRDSSHQTSLELKPPSFLIKSDIDIIDFEISIPRSNIDSLQYTGLLNLPSDTNLSLKNLFYPYQSKNDSNWVKISLVRREYFKYDGLYKLQLTEKVRDRYGKTFDYWFDIKNEQ